MDPQIVLLHFNDAYNIQPNQEGMLGFANFEALVRKNRQIHPSALTIFSGDALGSSRLSRMFRGQQMLYCLNALKIDVACFGNHDFDYEHEHSSKLIKNCNFPWLLGNIINKQTGKTLGNGLQYLIIENSGVKIGFLGLAGPDFVWLVCEETEYIPLVDHARKICAILIQQGCQLIVAVTHCRWPADTQLAQSVPEIDIILGGHDHDLSIRFENQIPIVKSGTDFEFLTAVKIRPLDSSKHQEDTYLGRRWAFDFGCQFVKKAENKDPTIDSYIQNAVKKYEEYQQNQKRGSKRPNCLLDSSDEDY